MKYKAFILPVLIGYAFSSLFADNVVTSGTTLQVSSGTTLVSNASLVIQNGGTINNQGTILLSGNLTNLSSGAADLGAGTVAFSGTGTQTINGPVIFGNLTLNNAAGVSLNASARVNGVLTFTNGSLTLGAYNLILGTVASVAGSPSATSMLVASGSGQVRKSFAAAESFTFPVGDDTGAAEYAPVTIQFTSGSFGTGNAVSLNLVNSAYPGAIGSYLNRYWNVSQNNISGFSCNASFVYPQADVSGTENLIYTTRITPTSVNYFAVTNAATNTLTASGISEFGTFTGIQQLANKTLNLTVLLEGLYNGSGTMRKAQGASGPQFPGNTADQISIELHNPVAYATKILTIGNVNLSTSGAAVATIPGLYGGSYYVTVRHRNSIETTTASPLSFAGSTVNYSFDMPSKAYGGNMILMAGPGSYYAVYGGDVTQDGSVDTGDMTPVDNDASAFVSGYFATDANGDGTVDTGDMTIVDNNASAFVTAVVP